MEHRSLLLSSLLLSSRLLLSLLLSSSLLVACGGGGGGGFVGPVASTSTFQLKQAYANNFSQTATQTWTVSGSIPVNGVVANVTGSGATTQSAVSNTTYDGAAALQKSQTASGNLVATVAGQSVNIPFPAITTTIFVSLGFDPLGTSTGGLFTFATAPVTIPFTARVGDTGSLGTFHTFATSVPPTGPVLNRVAFSYSLEADTASTAILRITQTGSDSFGATTITQFETFRLTPAGDITRLTGSATVAGQGTLTFTYN